jgi:hypothetical protein
MILNGICMLVVRCRRTNYSQNADQKKSPFLSLRRAFAREFARHGEENEEDEEDAQDRLGTHTKAKPPLMGLAGHCRYFAKELLDSFAVSPVLTVLYCFVSSLAAFMAIWVLIGPSSW